MLTELRVAAGIWVGLVAVGLVLILVRIALGKTNTWLVAMNLLSLGLTLYASACIDHVALVSRFNVDHSYELTGEGTKLDLGYLWNELGPGSIPALDRFIAEGRARRIAPDMLRDAGIAREELAVAFLARERDWRLWSFRDWRLAQYLAGTGDFADAPPAARTGETVAVPEAERPDSTMP